MSQAAAKRGGGKATGSPASRRVWRAFETHGLLLLTDRKLPSVASLVAGSPVRGSWWGHPRGREIFRAACSLAAHPDVLGVRLVSRKVTLVHRKLWPALVAVACSREPWQVRGLSRFQRSLLARAARVGQLRSDQLAAASSPKAKLIADAARELECRLLVYSDQVHTERGSHAKLLESWEHWMDRVGFAGPRLPVDQSKQRLDKLLRSLNKRFNADGELPWTRCD